MKVIDTTQTWVKELPQHWIEPLEAVEQAALKAKESGMPFYTADVESWNYSIEAALSVIAQVGWEFVSPINKSNGGLLMLFKLPVTPQFF